MLVLVWALVSGWVMALALGEALPLELALVSVLGWGLALGLVQVLLRSLPKEYKS